MVADYRRVNDGKQPLVHNDSQGTALDWTGDRPGAVPAALLVQAMVGENAHGGPGNRLMAVVSAIASCRCIGDDEAGHVDKFSN